MKASLADYRRACVFSMLGVHFRLIQLVYEVHDVSWNTTIANIVTYVLIINLVSSLS